MRREENDAMRTAILDAVVSCKLEAAGAEVSLSQLACKAGISERTLNRYFPDKEMLLYEAAVRFLRLSYELFAKEYWESVDKHMSGLERLIFAFRQQIAQNRNNMVMAKVFVRAYTTALRTAVYRNLPASGYDSAVRKIVLDCIKAGMEDGSIRKDIAPMQAYFLMSSNYSGLLQRLIYTYSVDATEEEHKRELLLVFDRYADMLEEYLSAERHREVSA